MLVDQLLEHLRGNVGFEDPHRRSLAIDFRLTLAETPIDCFWLPFPSRRSLVMLPNPMIEFSRQSADDSFVSRVGPTEASRGESAQLLVRANNHYRLAHPARLHGGGDARAGPTVMVFCRFALRLLL